jgi:putative SOS response-associated peptidase YedK
MFKEMHRPDPARPLHAQDKRMVVILPQAQYEAWLDAPAQRAMEFMNQFPAERLAMVAEPPPSAQAKPRPAAAARPPPPQQSTLF